MGEMPPFVTANLPAAGQAWVMLIDRGDRLDVRTNIIDRRSVVAFLRQQADMLEAGDRGLDVRRYPPTPST
jgi:hypothetical protein